VTAPTATTIEALRRRVEALPGKKQHANLVTALRSHGNSVTEARNTLSLAVDTARHVVVVVGDTIPKLIEARKRALSIARRLRKNLSAKIEAVADAKTEEAVIELKERARAAAKSVQEAWRTGLDSSMGGYRQIIEVASNANLSGARALLIKLDALASAEPPIDARGAEDVLARLSALRDAVGTLGLEGTVGRFLAAAVNNGAGAKELLTPEVQAFLTAHNLWGRLAVTLR